MTSPELTESVNSIYTFKLYEDLTLLDTVLAAFKEAQADHDIRYELLKGNCESPKTAFVRFEDPDTSHKFQQFLKQRGLEYEPVPNESELNLQLPGNLYVRGLLPTTTSDDLLRIFSTVGNPVSCKIIKDDYGVSKGYGFINFADRVEAQKAIDSLNGSDIEGNHLFVNHHISKRDRLKELEMKKLKYTNLYVKNFPDDLPKERLTEVFGKYGDIESVFLPQSSDNLNKGYAFINFKTHEDAMKAQEELDGFEISPGFNLQLGKAERRKDRMQHQVVNYNGSYYPYQSPYVPAQPEPSNSMYPSFIVSPDSNLISTATGLPIAGPQFQDSNLYITHLPLDFKDQDLYDLFTQFGQIMSAKIMTYPPADSAVIDEDDETENHAREGRSRGFGFVCFNKPLDASKALVAMNGYRVDESHVLEVSFAQRKENKYEKGRLHHHNQNHLGNFYNYLNQNFTKRSFSFPSSMPNGGFVPVTAPAQSPVQYSPIGSPGRPQPNSRTMSVPYVSYNPYYFYPYQVQTPPYATENLSEEQEYMEQK
ncbi:hypothetical protein OGAPHI_000379 [Ogataea philodendri]|uniref:RRM domain-containing protein n=1 Tax=Ogataea philodendri TaxID=1378263 RepID=A0A9P8TAJ4_9ASCO|nr:uncharacterized protein OGAPHI_000379 [Ogataea philodendri]KAH3671674.1 hypothetical protein OGAPHI_000379 [Ogataea philodendri]